VEYKVIEAKDTASNLQDQVNRHIEEGWIPTGGLAVVETHSWWFYQAMIRQPVSAEDDPQS
jgi:hypothetical protein